MPESAFIAEIFKTFGVSAIGIVIWVIYHKSTVKTFEQIIAEQAKREEQNLKFMQNMWESNFKLLQGMLERMDFQGSQLIRITEKIDSNQWCPYVRDIQHKSEV